MTSGNVFHYEAGEGSNSGLWIDLRWSIKRELYVSFRSNAVDAQVLGEDWIDSPGRSNTTR